MLLSFRLFKAKLQYLDHEEEQTSKMSSSESNTAELERAQKLKKEKNRISQQKHREKKRKEIERKTKEIEKKAKCIEKMMTILQKVKLAVHLHDMGQLEELVKTPTIKQASDDSSTSDISRRTLSSPETEDIPLIVDDGLSSSHPFIEADSAATASDSAMIGQNIMSSFYPKLDDNTSLGTQGFFQPTLDPFFWNTGMGNMFPSLQMPYFDTQSPLNLLPPVSMPSPWEIYPAIMAGM